MLHKESWKMHLFRERLTQLETCHRPSSLVGDYLWKKSQQFWEWCTSVDLRVFRDYSRNKDGCVDERVTLKYNFVVYETFRDHCILFTLVMFHDVNKESWLNGIEVRTENNPPFYSYTVLRSVNFVASHYSQVYGKQMYKNEQEER